MLPFKPLRRTGRLRVLETSFQFGLLALAFLAPVKAEVLTFAPGATTWDAVSANWLNSGGNAVTYFNSTDTEPVFNGTASPLTVAMAQSRTTGSMLLNGNVTIGSPLNDYILMGIGSELKQVGGGNTRGTFNTRLVGFPGGTGAITLKGRLTFNRNIEAGAGHSVIVAQGDPRLGPGATMSAGDVTVSSATEPYIFLYAGAGSGVVTTANFTAGETAGKTSIMEAAGGNYYIGGDMRLAHGGNADFRLQGGSLYIGGTLRLSDNPNQTALGTCVLSLVDTTLTVADSGGLPGIRGDFYVGGGDIGKAPKFQLSGTRVISRGGLLTFAHRIDAGVNNTIFDTTNGDIHITSRLWGKALIKEGPGVLKLTRDNANGGGGQGVLDGTIVRGGFVEFSSSDNLNDGGYLNHSIYNEPLTGLKNIQLNGGGLRWAAGATVDVSDRLRVLNNFSFDTNGNNVAFGTSLAGTGGMTKHGAGRLTLAETNPYTGGTTVLGGAVEFASLGTLGTGMVTLNGGALRWAVQNSVDVSARLNPLGVNGATFDTNGNNVTFAAAPLTGAGNFTKAGEGTLTLNGTHPWTGGLLVNGGDVAVNGTATGKAQITVGGTGTGTLTVSGAGTQLTTGTFIEVGSNGTGTLNLSNGGQVSSATTTALGVHPGAGGTVSVTGNGSLSTGTSLLVGYQGPALFTVGTGGVVTVGGQLSCGELPGGSGAFVLLPGGTLNVGGPGGIRTGTGEAGFYLSGGTLKVTGSSLTSTLPMVCTDNTLIDTSGVDCVLGGTLSGTGGIVKTGGGVLYLNVPNSYAGGTTLYGGQIIVPSAASLGGGSVSVHGGSVHSSGTFSRDVPIIVDGAGAALSAAGYMEIGVGAGGSLAVTNGAQVGTPSSIAFAVLPGGTSGFASVTGAGSLLACGTTMFLGYQGSGTLNVGSGGSVSVGGQLLLGSVPGGNALFNLLPGGALNVGGVDGIAQGTGSATFNLSGGTLKVTGSDLTTSVPMTLENFSLVDTSGVNCTLGGVLSGTGGIAKNGGGTLTLAAANNYTGNTAVFAGTLVLQNPTLADTADIALSSGTVLHLPFIGTDTVRRFTMDGLLQNTGTWGSLTSAATYKTALITGPGILNVTSVGAADFTIIPPANNTGTVGQFYSGTFTQSGAFGSVTWSHDPTGPGGSPPPGLTLSSTGMLSGTPTSAGSFGFTVKVTDPNGFFAIHVAQFTFTHPVITVQNPAVTSGRTNVPFSQSFISSGGNGASSFFLAIASGNLPPGLNLATDGTLSGTPTESGSYSFSVVATDIYGGTGTGAAYSLTIEQASSNANLANLGVSAGYLTPAFASATPDYQIVVGPDTALLYVMPTGVDPLASVTVNGNFTTNGGDSPGIALAMGTNVIPIVVTSSDFTTQKTYTLTATRTGGLVLTGGGLALLEEGGTHAPGNAAPAGTAFAKDVLPGYAAHSIPHLNDATSGNSNSWIANSPNSFAGISLGATPVRIDQIAFGRDNERVHFDRCLTRYTLQFSTAPNPDAATPDSSWTTIGTLDYLSSGGTNFATPSARHRYGFTPVMATGLRLVAVEAGTAVDEIEIIPQVGLVLTGGGLRLEEEGGTFAPQNLARSAGATPFADGVIVGYPEHSIPHLNDGIYGNSNSWIHDLAAPFAGVAPGSSRIVDRIAFGRDNTGVFANDRTFGVFTLQYTNDANPGAATPEGSWTTIGTLDYRFAGGHLFATPERRHLYSFTPVTATALRLVGSTGNNCIDELEIYRWQPRLMVEQPGSGGEFGTTLLGSPQSKVFTVINDGTVPLHLENLTIDGVHAADFSTTAPGSNTLAPGASTTFSATFAPTAEGPRSAMLHVASDDPDAPDFLIPLGGSGSIQLPIISGYGNLANSAWDEHGVVHFYPPASATDDSGIAPTISYSHPGGSLFPIGVTTVTITATDNFNNSSTATFTITISATTNPPPVPIGGTVPLNLALGKTAFAQDDVGVAPHAIAKANDGLYGNDNSWIAGTLDSFVGINLGATPILLNRVAFSRDHNGAQTTRADGTYTLQYTTVPNPDAATPDAGWQTIAAITYPGNVGSPHLRHLYGFPAVSATGFRLKTLGAIYPIGIDELELYGPLTPLENWRMQYFGSTANTGDAADGADPNHNGIPNLVEYALGGNPVNGSSGQSILPAASRDGNQMGIHFTRRLDRSDVDLTVQASGDLSTWTDLARSSAGQPFALIASGTGIGENGSGNTRTVTVTDPAGGNRRFLRLSVTPASAP